MNAGSTPPATPQELRARAEASLLKKATQDAIDLKGMTPEDARRLLHELQVHQIELDLQNEELRASHLALEQSRERFFDLYDLAPVGYCSVSESGQLLHANLTLATLLGVPRGALSRQPPFTHFIVQEDQDQWYRLRMQMLRDTAPRTTELRLRRDDPVWVQLSASLAHEPEGSRVLRLAITDISARKEAHARQLETEARWKFALEGSGEGLWDWNLQTGQAFYSPQYKAMLGYDEADIGTWADEWKNRIHPDDASGVMEALQPYLDGKAGTAAVEFRMRRKDGTWQWMLGRGMVVERTAQGKPLRMIGTNMDLTLRKESEAKLELAASVFSHAREGIMITDTQGTILEVNEAFSRITGHSREEALGQNPHFMSSGRQGPDFYAEMWITLAAQGHWSGEMWNRRKNGEVFVEQLTISAVCDAQGTTRQYVALFSDITTLKVHQAELEHRAHFDALTRLPNRMLLGDRLQQAMLQAQRRGLLVAVVYLDLDGFKNINDHYGHEAGDHVLTYLTRAMQDTLREGDTLARIGGDEFVAVLIDLESPDSYAPLLRRLLAAAAAPVPWGEHVLQVSASAGLTHYPQAEALSAEQLINQADQAMYQAKTAGKNCSRVFQP